MKTKLSYALLFITWLFSACSTDLDVTGQYKETMIIYGLLDQTQPKQYIKINKAFLGQGNSIAYATIKDSTQYVHALSVKLQKWVIDGSGKFISMVAGSEKTLSPDNSVPKDPGVFYAPDQANAIYSIDSASLGAGYFNPANGYKLVVANSETGTVATATTTLITDIGSFLSPSPTSPAPFAFILAGNNAYTFSVKWNSGINARLYQTIVRFNYIDSLATGLDTNHLDWTFPTQATSGLTGNEAMQTQFVGQNFLEFIGNQLHHDPAILSRRALKTDIILVAGSDDLNTFINVNAPSTGLIQDKPEFTNISNGLGIFSSRLNKAPFSKPLSPTTLDSLACGRYTKTLGFRDRFGNAIVCP
jgi:hypothetical protein